MTTPKSSRRKVAELAAPAAIGDAATAAIGGITPPTLDIGKPAGTIDAAPAEPAEPAEPEAAPEPITRPNGGGSFVRDRVTGHLIKQEA